MKSTITLTQKKHPVSPSLYGIFFEDINFGCDGGINANLVFNYSFDGVFLDRKDDTRVVDCFRGWTISGGKMESGDENALGENSKYARIISDGSAELSNLGFNGDKAYAANGAMAIAAGEAYTFEAYFRTCCFDGSVKVRVVDDEGKALTDEVTVLSEKVCEWTKVTAELRGVSTAYGKLVILFDGKGVMDVDCVSFMNSDYWNKDDPKYKYGKFRKDLIQALADIKPRFMRFPGGCIVEGKFLDNGYKWKNTIGELYNRKGDYNLWAEDMPTGSYNQSYQIGFYEYFCLCEDLGMKPLPTLNVGLGCQVRSMQRGEPEYANIPVEDEAFKNVVGDFLDLIEFANGDPAESKWAAIRAQMGHPEPFGLDRIGIGNEQYDDIYFERYGIIEKAIHEKYPDMLCIFCAGIHPFKAKIMGAPSLEKVYAEAGKYENVLVDEHSYHSPGWFERNNTRFDSYDRKGPGVYFGEYSANGLLGAIDDTVMDINVIAEHIDEMMKKLADEALGGGEAEKEAKPVVNTSNQLVTALGEAAFLTGVERNSDIVRQTSYAPLFNLVGCEQWTHNLIDFNPAGVCLTSNYFMLKLFGSYLGNDYVFTDGELPEHVFASCTESEDAYYVKLVNTGDTAHDVKIVFPGKLGNAVGEVMRNDDTTARNDLGFYGETDYRVAPVEKTFKVNGNELEVPAESFSITAIRIAK